MVNSLLAYFSTDDQFTSISSNITSEGRVKVISKIQDSEVRDSLTKLNSALNTAEVSTFLEELETVSPKLDIMLKKGVDKRREKVLLSEHRQLLLLQLQELCANDPILGLHIATMLVFQATHDAMLHTSGKLLPAILSALEKDVAPEMFSSLKSSQDLVLALVASKDEAVKAQLTKQLQTLFNEYKGKVMEYKRPPPPDDDAKE